MTRPVPCPDTVARSYDTAAATYDDAHGDARSIRRFAIIDAPQLAAARGATRVLELGCGTGRLLAQVRARVRVGIDIAPAMLVRARARHLLVAVADAHALPFAANTFDAVLAGKGVFRYLDYERAFAECARVLAPGGKLAVHQYAARTWSAAQLLGRHARDNGEPLHVRDLDELYAPARRAGLAVQHTHLFRSVRVPPYAVAVPRWLPGHWWSHCVIVFSSPQS